MCRLVEIFYGIDTTGHYNSSNLRKTYQKINKQKCFYFMIYMEFPLIDKSGRTSLTKLVSSSIKCVLIKSSLSLSVI